MHGCTSIHKSVDHWLMPWPRYSFGQRNKLCMQYKPVLYWFPNQAVSVWALPGSLFCVLEIAGWKHCRLYDSSSENILNFVLYGTHVKKMTNTLSSGKGIYSTRGGGALPSNGLLGMCRWMGSHFHNLTDYNGVTFSSIFNRVTGMGSHFFGTSKKIICPKVT